ncbi:hypothetical protein [Streptomyces sp. NPDC046161]|uniref:hypothetical protein n=1 Tax=Streptomyces sp. NPDC046161 TaxID=3155132 RepID=UPI0033C890F6
MNIHRDHDLVVAVWRTVHAGDWIWECPGEHCQQSSGRAATHPEAMNAACQHLAEQFDAHHQVEFATEGGGGCDSRAVCRCGTERSGHPETNAAENDLEWHISWAAESIPAAYRKHA